MDENDSGEPQDKGETPSDDLEGKGSEETYDSTTNENNDSENSEESENEDSTSGTKKSNSKKLNRIISDTTEESGVESENADVSNKDSGLESENEETATAADVKTQQANDSSDADEPQTSDDEKPPSDSYVSSPQEPQSNEAYRQDYKTYGETSSGNYSYNQYTSQPGSDTPLSPQPGSQGNYGGSAYEQQGTYTSGGQDKIDGNYIGSPDNSKASDYKGLTPMGSEAASSEQPKEGINNEYNYTQQDQGNKTKILIILGLAVVFIVILLLLIPRLTAHSSNTSSITKSNSSTTQTEQNSIGTEPQTTTIPSGVSVSKPYDVVINNVDDIFNYTGPTTNGQTNCDYSSHSKYVTYSNIVNSSSEFLGSWIATSGSCPLTIEGIYVESPGFGIINVNPSTPITLPQNSTLYFSITLTSPKGSYEGPLTFLIRED